MQYQEIVDEQRRHFLFETPDHWKAFHECEERQISVYAGRRSGKTYNLMLRALNSDHDSIIFVPSQMMISSYKNEMEYLINSSERIEIINLVVDHYMMIVQLSNGRTITVTLFGSHSSVRGKRFIDMNVMFDEPERFRDFHQMINALELCIERSAHIICVGSMESLSLTPYRQWFNISDTQLVIPTPRDMLPEVWSQDHMFQLYPERHINISNSQEVQ